MLSLIFASIVLLCSLILTAAECPNACSTHGRCGAYDMCVCYRNWMANDCSQRVCQFGLAHVDTPMGDLDASGGPLSGPDTTVVVNDVVYPFGTTEQFPSGVDSDGMVVPNTAHYYRECSNKGTCDRASGDCTCFDGYGGSACQRATCPTSSSGVCSGHGTCETISTIAAWDNDNIYNLWDEHATMGCVCDGAYTGPDCSQRTCKVGPDPLYFDDAANVRVSNFTIQFYVNTAAKDIIGNYSIVFFDSYDEDWQTIPIDIDADCNVIIAALEGIPNGVIPTNSVKCFRADVSNSGTFTAKTYTDGQVTQTAGTYIKTRYTVAFTQNFGRLKQPEINIYLDGTRPTLYTDETGSTLGYHVYPNGFIGEEDDLVPDECEGVLVTITKGINTVYYDLITPGDAQQMKALKKCLGSSDGDGVSDVSDVYDWDHGTIQNPHLVKLIEATQESLALNTPDLLRDPSLYDYPVSRICDRTGFYMEKVDRMNVVATGMRENQGTNNVMDGTGWCANRNPAGFYAVIYWDSGASFKVFTRPGVDYDSNTKFHIYTTKGYLQLVNPNAGVFTHTFPRDHVDAQYAKNTHSRTLYLVNNSAVADFKGQVDCETAPKGSFGSLDCLNKDDYVMVLNTQMTEKGYKANPIYPNIYKVSKIFREEKKFRGTEGLVKQSPQNEVARHQIILDYGMNTKYVQQTAGYDSGLTDPNGPEGLIFKFYPVAPYNYVGECSNRGICDSASGVCSCFRGYTGDNCGIQNALSK